MTNQLSFVLTHFRRRTTVKMLCIYADYKSDESYTPSKISVRVGNNFHNLQEIRVQTLWCCHCHTSAETGTQVIYFILFLILLLFFSAAVRDGGAQWLDSYLSDESGEILVKKKKRLPLEVCVFRMKWVIHSSCSPVV